LLDALVKLTAVEEIKQLKARYFRELDTKNWDGLNSVFAADAVFDLRAVNSVRQPLTGELSPPEGGEDRVFRGRTAIVEMIRNAVESLITVHHGHTPEIEVLSETTARGIVPMEDVLRLPSGELLLNGFGHYHETYQKFDAGWQIKTSRLTRLFIAGVPLSIPGQTRQ
jgi:SnoaL-like domain